MEKWESHPLPRPNLSNGVKLHRCWSDGWTAGYAGTLRRSSTKRIRERSWAKGQSVVGCVCGRRRDGQTRVRCVDRKILTTGGGSSSHPVAAALSNLTCELRTRCPCIVAIHRSRLTRHSPAPICPFYLSATDAGRPGSDWRLAIRSTRACRKLPGLICRHCESPLVSPTMPTPLLPPPCAAETHGACQPEHGQMDGRAEEGGRPSTWRRSLVAGVRLHMKMALLQYYKEFHAVTK